jgi:hypothetical protein
MSDWEQIAEYIHNAMQAVEQTHEAGRELREKPNHTNFDAFRTRMDELHQRLTTLKSMLEHENVVFLDELADALSKAFGGKPAEYHHIEQYGEKIEP